MLRILSVLLFLLPALPITAAPAPFLGVATQGGQNAQQGETLDQAVRRIRRETGGRILRAETITQDGRRQHRIKVLLPDGRVKIYRVRAR